MKLAYPLLLLTAASLSGCVLDPVSLMTDPIMIAAGAAEPSDAERKAENDAYIRQVLLTEDRNRSCKELTQLWPEVRALHLKNSVDGQMYVDVREQAMAEKGCIVPAPLAESSAQPKPDVAKTVTAPAAVPPVAIAPPSPNATLLSDGALSTSIAQYTARETPERYRHRSCDYLHAKLRESQPGLTNEDPEVRQWAQKTKSVVSEVLVENNCGPATWIGGRIGAVISTIDPVKAPRLKLPRQGVWVETVVPGSSAERGGLLRGDTIVAVNDVPVADASEFFVIVLKQPVGTTIRVKFWRVRNFVELPIVVAAAPAS